MIKHTSNIPTICDGCHRGVFLTYEIHHCYLCCSCAFTEEFITKEEFLDNEKEDRYLEIAWHKEAIQRLESI